MGGNGRPGGFGPVVEGKVLPHHPFEPTAPAISRNKPLIVGYNRDETIFFLQQQRNTEVFNLTEAALEERLGKEFGGNAGAVYDAYHKSRPEDSPADLYIAIGTARIIGIGAITIAERKYAQHGAPVYSYIFTHESDAVVPGTQHKVGAAHAQEIVYKFNNVRPDGAGGSDAVKAARNMSEMWSTFARTGRPAAKGQPEWPAYTTAKRATMEINTECKIVDDPYTLERKLWDKLDPSA